MATSIVDVPGPADSLGGWIASMRHIAIEVGAFVVSVPQYIPASAFPDDFPLALPDGIDLREALHAKRYFDVIGHYGRADVLAPSHPSRSPDRVPPTSTR